MTHARGQVQRFHIPKAQGEIPLGVYSTHLALCVPHVTPRLTSAPDCSERDLGERLPEKGKAGRPHCALASSSTQQTPVLSSTVGSHLSPAESERWNRVSGSWPPPCSGGEGGDPLYMQAPLVTKADLPSSSPRGTPGKSGFPSGLDKADNTQQNISRDQETQKH